MTWNEIRMPIAIGLVVAIAIVVLGILDALSLALFVVVLVVGGLISAIGAAYFDDDGVPPPSIESSDKRKDRLKSKRRNPPTHELSPEPEAPRPEDAGGAAPV